MGITTEYNTERNITNKDVLSVIYDSDSFFYVVTDSSGAAGHAKKYSIQDDEDFRSWIEREFSGQNFAAVHLFAATDDFTFVPNALEEVTYAADYVYNMLDIQEEDYEVMSNKLGDREVHFAVDTDMVEIFHRVFNNSEMHHISESVLRWEQTDGLTALVYAEKLHVSVRKEGNNVFYNHFDIQTVEDGLYYISLAFQQLECDPRGFRVTLLGEQESCASLLQLLKKYCAHAEYKNLAFPNMEDATDISDLYLVSQCV